MKTQTIEIEILGHAKNGKVTEFIVWRLRDGVRFCSDGSYKGRGYDSVQMDLVLKDAIEDYKSDLARWYGKGK